MWALTVNDELDLYFFFLKEVDQKADYPPTVSRWRTGIHQLSFFPAAPALDISGAFSRRYPFYDGDPVSFRTHG